MKTKKEIVVTLSYRNPYYKTPEGPILCSEFVEKSLGIGAPTSIKVTVANYRMHRCKKVTFSGCGYVTSKGLDYPRDVRGRVAKWVRNSFGYSYGKVLYFNIVKA